MVKNWKINKEKSCLECENHSSESYYPEYGWQGGLEHDCSIINQEHSEELDFLISTIEGAMEDLDTDNQENKTNIAYVMANICPFYRRS